MSTDAPIVLDSDFVSSFAWVDRMDILENLYSNRMIILEEVMEELDRVPHLAARVRLCVEKGHITTETMLAGSPEALQLVRFHESGRYGAGEASCMAYLVYRGGILASNNLSDVKAFCAFHRMPLLTTPDVLLQSYEDGRLGACRNKHTDGEATQRRAGLARHFTKAESARSAECSYCLGCQD